MTFSDFGKCCISKHVVERQFNIPKSAYQSLASKHFLFLVLRKFRYEVKRHLHCKQFYVSEYLLKKLFKIFQWEILQNFELNKSS